MILTHTRRRVLALALVMPVAYAAGMTDVVVEALKRPAIETKQPQRAMLIGAAQAGKRIVAVGERGLALVSEDKGTSWKQSSTPVSVTLTGVRFADENNGVAIGHAGVVLVTNDAGATWTLVLDGRRAAELAVEATNSLPDGNVNKATFVADAERLVTDGPDKPFLDVLVDGKRIVVVGAYGLAFASEDGGKNWVSWMPRLDNPRGMYLYAIRKRGDTLILAGEQGFLLRSNDNGATFEALPSPYEGSWFTAEFGGNDEILLAGLRGNVFRSADDGASWQAVEGANGASVASSAKLVDGSLVFGSQSGQLLKLDGNKLVALNEHALPPINGVYAADGNVLALTVQGIFPVDMNADRPAAEETK